MLHNTNPPLQFIILTKALNCIDIIEINKTTDLDISTLSLKKSKSEIFKLHLQHMTSGAVTWSFQQ